MQNLSEKQLIIYGIYSHILDVFQHYNTIQVKYRLFISTWLLATFIGLGYILSAYEVSMPFHPLIAISLVSLASFLGIITISYMDIIVTERSIAIIVHESVQLEKDNKWLPQVVNTCDDMNKLFGYISNKKFFYLGCVFIVFITLLSMTIMFKIITHVSTSAIYTAISILICMVIYLVIFTIKKIDPYSDIKRRKYCD